MCTLQLVAAGGKTTNDVDFDGCAWHGQQLTQTHLHWKLACRDPNVLTCALCCSAAEGGGGGGDTFDDGGGDDGDTAAWDDTVGSPQQSFQTQGTSAAQASESSQVYMHAHPCEMHKHDLSACCRM